MVRKNNDDTLTESKSQSGSSYQTHKRSNKENYHDSESRKLFEKMTTFKFSLIDRGQRRR